MFGQRATGAVYLTGDFAHSPYVVARQSSYPLQAAAARKGVRVGNVTPGDAVPMHDDRSVVGRYVVGGGADSPHVVGSKGCYGIKGGYSVIRRRDHAPLRAVPVEYGRLPGAKASLSRADRPYIIGRDNP